MNVRKGEQRRVRNLLKPKSLSYEMLRAVGAVVKHNKAVKKAQLFSLISLGALFPSVLC